MHLNSTPSSEHKSQVAPHGLLRSLQIRAKVVVQVAVAPLVVPIQVVVPALQVDVPVDAPANPVESHAHVPRAVVSALVKPRLLS
jgi:hypothetical protein